MLLCLALTGACHRIESVLTGDAPPASVEAPSPAPARSEALEATAPAADRPTAAALEAITPALLRAHVEHLADDGLRGRATPSDGLERAAEYIVRSFAELGIPPPERFPDYRQRFVCGRPEHLGQPEAANVIAVLPGRDPALREQAVMVTAHYDHIGTLDAGEGDRIYNGANDNASGTAAVLALGRFFATLPAAPRRTVVFATFCGEELGLRGSRHHVRDPVIPLDRVVAVVNLEMLGRPSPENPAQAWITGFELSTLGETFVEIGPSAGVEFVTAASIGPIEGAAFDRSDNLPFADAGVVAHSISTGRLGPLYHSVEDEPDTLDYDTMAMLVRGIASATLVLADAEERPSWTPRALEAGYGR